MSGILAVAGQAPGHPDLLAQLTGTMAFRGPDGRATEVVAQGGEWVGFGHTLLRTTTDPPEWPGPLEREGCWVCADARIDGRSELRQRLAAAGRATTDDTSDAELILLAYLCWGMEAWSRLLGDFAFALWDGRKRQLVCVRDLFGVVPAYLVHHERGLVFTNTLACARSWPGVSSRLAQASLVDHIIFGAIQDAGATFFADVRALPPAHALVWQGGTVKQWQYQSVPSRSRTKRQSEGDVVAQFGAVFTAAVKDRLRTSQVGVMMSGGLDSIAVAAAARRARANLDLRAHTVVLDHYMPDQEGAFARQAAEALHIPQELHRPDLTTTPEAARDGSPWVRMAGWTRVALTGMGGDAALYPEVDHWLGLLLRGRPGRFLGDVVDHVRAHGRLPWWHLRQAVKLRLGRSVWQPHVPSFIRQDLARRLDLHRRVDAIALRMSDKARTGMISPTWARELSSRDPDHTGLCLRARHPFFDLRLLRFLQEAPPMPWLEDKLLLREWLRGQIPEAVRRRPKTPLVGFPAHAAGQRLLAWDPAVAAELEQVVDGAAVRAILAAPRQHEPLTYRCASRTAGLVHMLAKPLRVQTTLADA